MISIIVPTYKRPDLTEVCIDSIFLYTKDFELILIQEGEDEEITKLLTQKFQFLLTNGEKIKFTQNKTPKGFSGAMNTGLDLASKDSTHYCFMNNDVVVTPGWMDAMLKAFDLGEVGIVTPTMQNTRGAQSMDWNDGKEFTYVYDPMALMGVCYLISKEALNELKRKEDLTDEPCAGRWDERFGQGGYEDYDLALRMHNAGYNTVVARKAFIYHYSGATFREVFGGQMETLVDYCKGQCKILETKHHIKIQ